MKAITTGFGVSWIRAAGMLYPKEKRLYDDPFSEKILTGMYKFLINLMHIPKIFDIIMKSIEKNSPGAIGSQFCRYRYIDDQLKNNIAKKKIETVVNLGVGMDARAYFIPGVESIHYFELDHPSVIKKKIKIIKEVLGKLPDNVVYVPIDFEKQSLDNELKNAGYNLSSKTLFIWEGVTQYLSEEAVDSTLKYVSSAPGSKIVFTYVLKSFIDGENIHNGIKAIYDKYVRKSKIFIYGLAPSDIGDFLSKYSLSIIEDIGSNEYKERYMKPAGLNLEVNEIERMVLAEVKK